MNFLAKFEFWMVIQEADLKQRNYFSTRKHILTQFPKTSFKKNYQIEFKRKTFIFDA